MSVLKTIRYKGNWYDGEGKITSLHSIVPNKHPGDVAFFKRGLV